MTDDFAPDGQLAKAIPGFKPREPQRQMAVAVTQAIEKGQPLVVEAGTGTGKTYAYLAPALRAKKKVIISTGSKALQDQLYSRDLPTVSKALKYTGNVALLNAPTHNRTRAPHPPPPHRRPPLAPRPAAHRGLQDPL